MVKFLKPGKVVVVLAGRYAGRKAVIVKVHEDGHADRKFGHCIIAGIDRYPRKVTRSMGKKKTEKRQKIKPFVKFVNFNHIMPTRYQVDLDLKSVSFTSADKDDAATVQIKLDEETLSDPAKRMDARKGVKAVLEEAYKKQGQRKSAKANEAVQYFYKKLRF